MIKLYMIGECNMKKKGFTLIELLAVIVILAVLALILTPMIQDLILNARKSAFERSIDGILSAAEYYQMENPSDESITFECNGISCEDSNGHKLTFKGEVPISGTITISETGVVAENLCNSSFCGSGSRESLAINVGGGSSLPACDIPVGEEWEFDYLDDTHEDRIHTMNVPCKGYYKLEVWGAQGGSYNATYHGGYGGYSEGYILLEETDTLYIAVGGKGVHLGSNVSGNGGYNGGGSILEWWSDGNERRSTGGGATHIALNNNLGELKYYVDNQDDVLIVAGGGGGGHDNAVLGASGYGIGGSGGGTNGGNTLGYQYSDKVVALGATQETGKGHGSFGQGGTMPVGGEKPGLFSGGGGGWYGGEEGWRGGAGGSGHLSNKLVDGKMYCYGCMEEEDSFTENTTDVSTTPESEVAKKDNGYAKVTYIGAKISTAKLTWKYKYTGTTQEFTAPETGVYKLEVWGAAGGDASSSYIGGYGAYSEGQIRLNKNDKIYITVGEKPITSTGGYNGGGDGGNNNYGVGLGGGGATHMATITGELKDLHDNQDKVIIVAGGGGGATWETAGRNYDNGGHGGGKQGTVLTGSSTSYDRPTPGTQLAGGTGACSSGNAGFGYGGNSCPWSGGGGSGYYGGGGGSGSAGAGGSGYIGYNGLTNAKMVCYNCIEDTENESTYTETTTCANDVAKSGCSKKGNGSARITLIK